MFDIWELLVASLRSLVMLPSVIQALPSSFTSTKRIHHNVVTGYDRTMDDFLQETRRLFQSPITAKKMLAMSDALQEEFKQKLQSSNISMLPSYIYTLPTGQERGSYLALDVGGSTFRVAFVELSGRENEKESMRIVKMCTYKICNLVKALEGHQFFDWMANKIEETLDDPVIVEVHGTDTLIMGLAWSFPIQYGFANSLWHETLLTDNRTTSPGTGILLDMGKGFKAGNGVAGQDIGSLIMLACQKKVCSPVSACYIRANSALQELNVRLDAIINDGQATLLTRAYQDDATCFGLILGTGTNMSVVLPVNAFGQGKFGERPQSWFDNAEHVLVNTEMSMFGKQIYPATRWDEALNKAHSHPDFQPLEYFIGGRYQGEIVRLILVDAIHTIGLYDGQYPEHFLEPYSLETSTMAAFEE
jgi:hexokinase